PHANPEEALNQTFDLFIELGASDEQADFPVIYTIGLEGRAGMSPDNIGNDLVPLFETILKEIPAPTYDESEPAALLVTTLEYDNYKGQIGIGRLHSGTLRKGMPVLRVTPSGERISGRIE